MTRVEALRPISSLDDDMTGLGDGGTDGDGVDGDNERRQPMKPVILDLERSEATGECRGSIPERWLKTTPAAPSFETRAMSSLP